MTHLCRNLNFYGNFNIMASFETIFLLYGRKNILGIFFTHSMTLLDRKWSEKSNGVGFRAIRHTQCKLGQYENRSRTSCSPCIWVQEVNNNISPLRSRLHGTLWCIRCGPCRRWCRRARWCPGSLQLSNGGCPGRGSNRNIGLKTAVNKYLSGGNVCERPLHKSFWPPTSRCSPNAVRCLFFNAFILWNNEAVLNVTFDMRDSTS
jgi:hypothetical protein